MISESLIDDNANPCKRAPSPLFLIHPPFLVCESSKYFNVQNITLRIFSRINRNSQDSISPAPQRATSNFATDFFLTCLWAKIIVHIAQTPIFRQGRRVFSIHGALTPELDRDSLFMASDEANSDFEVIGTLDELHSSWGGARDAKRVAKSATVAILKKKCGPFAG